MPDVFLSHSSLGWDLIAQAGSSGGVLAFCGVSLSTLAYACVAIGVFAAISGGCGPRRMRRCGGNSFWIIPLVVAVAVVAGVIPFRARREAGHPVAVAKRDDRLTAERELDLAVARLEREIDRAGNQLDRAGDQLDRAANQVDRALDRGASQVDGQLDRGAARLIQQLQRVAAQVERQIEHVGRQIEVRRREAQLRHVALAQTPEEPAVIEPNPPALPTPPTTLTPPSTPAAQPAAPATAAAPSGAAKSSPTTKAEATADAQDEKLPDWTKTEIVDDGNRKLVSVPGGFEGSQKDAERDSLEAARQVVGDSIQRAYPKVGRWLPSADAVRAESVRHTFVEKIHRKTVSSGTPFIVYRAYQQVELSPEVSSRLLSSWKEQVVPRRLEALGGLAVLLTLTFATGAAYFRLDDRTQGRYRVPLKVAAGAIIGACLAAAAVTVFV